MEHIIVNKGEILKRRWILKFHNAEFEGYVSVINIPIEHSRVKQTNVENLPGPVSKRFKFNEFYLTYELNYIMTQDDIEILKYLCLNTWIEHVMIKTQDDIIYVMDPVKEWDIKNLYKLNGHTIYLIELYCYAHGWNLFDITPMGG